MAQLGEFGCRFALDDFGAGTAALRYLKQLPVEFLKLDGQLTRGLPTDAADRAIAEAVVRPRTRSARRSSPSASRTRRSSPPSASSASSSPRACTSGARRASSELLTRRSAALSRRSNSRGGISNAPRRRVWSEMSWMSHSSTPARAAARACARG